MRYLKKFNEKNDPIISELNDICDELKDIGFGVDIWDMSTQFSKKLYKSCYGIIIHKENRKNFWSIDKIKKNDEGELISSVVHHFSEYMKDLGFIETKRTEHTYISWDFKIKN